MISDVAKYKGNRNTANRRGDMIGLRHHPWVRFRLHELHRLVQECCMDEGHLNNVGAPTDGSG